MRKLLIIIMVVSLFFISCNGAKSTNNKNTLSKNDETVGFLKEGNHVLNIDFSDGNTMGITLDGTDRDAWSDVIEKKYLDSYEQSIDVLGSVAGLSKDQVGFLYESGFIENVYDAIIEHVTENDLIIEDAYVNMSSRIISEASKNISGLEGQNTNETPCIIDDVTKLQITDNSVAIQLIIKNKGFDADFVNKTTGDIIDSQHFDTNETGIIDLEYTELEGETEYALEVMVDDEIQIIPFATFDSNYNELQLAYHFCLLSQGEHELKMFVNGQNNKKTEISFSSSGWCFSPKGEMELESNEVVLNGNTISVNPDKKSNGCFG
jgi:hypothetical protein